MTTPGKGCEIDSDTLESFVEEAVHRGLSGDDIVAILRVFRQIIPMQLLGSVMMRFGFTVTMHTVSVLPFLQVSHGRQVNNKWPNRKDKVLGSKFYYP